MIVAVDFDNTIIQPLKFPYINTWYRNYKLMPNCKEVLNELNKKGIQFKLNTARYGWFRLYAILFIKMHKLPIKTQLFNKKVHADYYIDDSNIERDKSKPVDWLYYKQQLLQKLKGDK